MVWIPTVRKQQKLKVRSVFISDIHLGFKGCQADSLLHFLHSVETDYLFLVGDIVDFWALKRPYLATKANQRSSLHTWQSKARHESDLRARQSR